MNLDELETRLSKRPATAPSAMFKERVLQATERASNEPFRSGRPLLYFHWSIAAAALLIVMNISTITASRHAFSLDQNKSRDGTATELPRLQSRAQQNQASK